MKKKKSNSWKAWTIGLLGIWLIISAYLGLDPRGNTLNNILIGISVASLGYTMIKQHKWQAIVSMIIGTWMIIAAFIPIFLINNGCGMNNLICGFFVILGGFSTLEDIKLKNEKAHTHI